MSMHSIFISQVNPSPNFSPLLFQAESPCILFNSLFPVSRSKGLFGFSLLIWNGTQNLTHFVLDFVIFQQIWLKHMLMLNQDHCHNPALSSDIVAIMDSDKGIPFCSACIWKSILHRLFIEVWIVRSVFLMDEMLPPMIYSIKPLEQTGDKLVTHIWVSCAQLQDLGFFFSLRVAGNFGDVLVLGPFRKGQVAFILL